MTDIMKGKWFSYQGPFIYLDMDDLEEMFVNILRPEGPEDAETDKKLDGATLWVIEKTADNNQHYWLRREGEGVPPGGLPVVKLFYDIPPGEEDKSLGFELVPRHRGFDSLRSA